MKKLLIILALVVIPAVTSGDVYFADEDAVVASGGAACDDTTGMLIAEDCEGAGAPAGWTSSGPYDWDSTAVALRSTQSLSLGGTSGSTYYTLADPTEIYWFMRFQTTNVTTEHFVLEIRNSGLSVIGDLRVRTDGKFYYTCGGTDATSLGTYSVLANTPLFVWGRYKAGSGADAICQLWVGTTKTMPVSPDINRSNGTSTTGVNRFYLKESIASLFSARDQIRVKATAIGDVCD